MRTSRSRRRKYGSSRNVDAKLARSISTQDIGYRTPKEPLQSFILRLQPITRPLNVRRDLLDDRPSRFSVFFYFSLLNFIACFAAALTAALAVAFSVCFVLNVRRRIALFDRIPDDDTFLFEFSNGEWLRFIAIFPIYLDREFFVCGSQVV